MKAWLRYAICGVVGIGLGSAAAVQTIRGATLGASSKIGQWVTGTDFGVKSASAMTRAVIALRGLLALPAHEARYYTTATDDAGRPLEGRCRYRVTGGAIPAKWWSVALYDREGYLVPNAANRYSIGSFSLPASEQGSWAFTIARDRQVGHWLPSGGIAKFELSVRAYLPLDGGQGNLTAGQLPHVVREDCA